MTKVKLGDILFITRMLTFFNYSHCGIHQHRFFCKECLHKALMPLAKSDSYFNIVATGNVSRERKFCFLLCHYNRKLDVIKFVQLN